MTEYECPRCKSPLAEADLGPATFEFTATEGKAWSGVPVVNGHRILCARRITVAADATAVPVVTLELLPADGLRLMLGDARVEVHDRTREALISLGWTPPEPAP